MTKQIKVKDHKEKKEFWKQIATPQAGEGLTIVVDQLGLALLLMTVYGQKVCGVDWTHERGDMFIFSDNPTVRTCVSVWRESIKEDDIMSVTERYLFNLIHLGDHDIFHEIERIETEKREWREEVRNRLASGQIKTAQATEQGDNTNE
jgi:hypothetical protein